MSNLQENFMVNISSVVVMNWTPASTSQGHMITILIQSVFFLSGHQSSAVQDQQYQLPVEIDPLIGMLS